MSKDSFKDQMKDPRWQRKRLAIFERDGWMCSMCQSTESQLHVHHRQYIKGKKYWDYDDGELVTLCSDCHSQVTALGNAIKWELDFDPVFQLFSITLNICKAGKWFDLLCILKLLEKNPESMNTFLRRLKK